MNQFKKIEPPWRKRLMRIMIELYEIMKLRMIDQRRERVLEIATIVL